MIGREKRMLLRHYLEQGVSKSALARELGISRDTIHRWIRAGDLNRDLDAGPVQYGPRPPVATKLDAFKAIIRTRLDAYPELSAVRLLEEIRAAGYTGGYTQLKEYVRRVRPLPEPEPVVRFETPAGRQAQVDFARFRFGWGVRYALLVVLGYSRVLWLRFYRRQDMRALLVGLEEAFAFFGGVPQELLFDQMRSVITKDLRLQGGDLVRNAEFLRFADHWGFTPRACRPYRAQTKGKVDRPVRYVRGTTHERPTVRFERDERVLLQPLAARPYYSLVLDSAPGEATSVSRPRPLVEVEKRSLAVYARLAGGVG